MNLQAFELVFSAARQNTVRTEPMNEKALVELINFKQEVVGLIDKLTEYQEAEKEEESSE